MGSYDASLITPDEVASAVPGTASANISSSPADMLTAAIKLGNVEAVNSIIVQFPEALNTAESQDGATAVHWAALFGNMTILHSLLKAGAPVEVPIERSGMLPIHWASTRGNVDAVKALIAHGGHVDALDIKQTTPLVIAAQYDHTVLVFYLVKIGADISKLDDCADSALHWAAYKGNLQTAALLHYLGLPADAADCYGSTPLHLAAARNAPNVIEYLIDESSASVERMVALKDEKGRTPLDVAKERGNALAVRLLMKVKPTCWSRLINGIGGNDGSKVMWYFYLINGAAAYIIYGLLIVHAVGTPAQHYAYVAINALMQICYVGVHCTDPGDISTGQKSREGYEAALQSAADGVLTDPASMPLCHTCRIVKPLRSKHCTVAKRCIPMFDHYCPYINNTIGGGNYIWFLAFIFTGMFGVGATFLVSLQYLAASGYTSALGWVMSVFWGLTSLMALMMNRFHAQLVLVNLTTNEELNKHRYHYLRDDLDNYRNPFSAGFCGNCAEVVTRAQTNRVNPYAYTEAYQRFLLSKDVELGDLTESGSTTDGSEAGGDDDERERTLLADDSEHGRV